MILRMLARMLTARLALCGAVAALTFVPRTVGAHCDGLDGPVVMAARKALDAGDVKLVLPWVPQRDEPEVERAFGEVRALREKTPEAKQLADRYFFETVVRLHRVSEGAPYTGLKAAGRDLGPAIPAADQALATGDIEPVIRLVTQAAERGLREQFAKARAARSAATGDVQAGRAYVESYVRYIHYVEGLYEAASRPVAGHYAESTEPERH
ncbi:MAG TPA: DUF6448 family protein [Candidatus Binatia bacterium]|nr:DUF6448 family protein [Candidatus Binatia bacterium]